MRSLSTSNAHGYLILYFQIHQPRRLNRIGFFDIGSDASLFDDALNERVIKRVARQCYQPANLMLLELINRYPNINITFSISGIALEQLERYAPEVIESLRHLHLTGSVEFLAESYFHSLASLVNEEEFTTQVQQHVDLMDRLIGARPSVFRNTELIYSNRIGRMVNDMGFRGIFVEGHPGAIPEQHLHQMLGHAGRNALRVFARDFVLSDDIAFRFVDKSWDQWPLTSSKYFQWLTRAARPGRLVNLGLDYETFGEHMKGETGIFEFLGGLLSRIAKAKTMKMLTPAEAIVLLPPVATVDAPAPYSWSDREKDLSAWLGNDLQKDAFRCMGLLGERICNWGNTDLIRGWRQFQTSDHFYYMCIKRGPDGQVHNYFSPYPSPYEAFINYMNGLACLELALERDQKKSTCLPNMSGERANQKMSGQVTSVCS